MNTAQNPTQSTLMRNIDALLAESQPLPPHPLQKHDEHIREIYASTLAAVLLAEGTIGELQSRLFSMLLAAMNLSGAEARIYERVEHACSQDGLREFARALESNTLSQSFFVDCFVLSRLENPLSEPIARVISELSDYLKIIPSDLNPLVDLALTTLGLPCERKIPEQLDYAPFSSWEEFLYREISAEELAQGVTGGRWKIARPIVIRSGWRIANSKIRFVGAGRLTTEADRYSVSIFNCTLDKPIINFNGRGQINIQDTTTLGRYAEIEKNTALCFEKNSAVDIRNSTFSTKNARSILLQRDAEATITSSTFEDCGNNNLPGGAICARSRGDYGSSIKTIRGCFFKKCTASVGGGIRAETIPENGIMGCSFEACASNHTPPNLDNHKKNKWRSRFCRQMQRK